MKQSAADEHAVQGILFEDVFQKPVGVKFDAPDQSSDGGVLLVSGLDYTLGLSRWLAQALHDPRQPGKVRHEQEEMLRSRIYGMCCGYEDVNDADHLRGDPLFQFLCANQGAGDLALASGSTQNRLENQVTWRDLLRMGYALMDWQLRHQRRMRDRRVRTVTVDLDPTDDPTYGQQEWTFFHGHYGNYVYLPLLGFVTFHDEQGREEREQYLVGALLRSGRASATEGARTFLRRLFRRLRELFPGVAIRVRLDGGFATPEMLDFLDQEEVRYLVNLPPNAVLRAHAEAYREAARQKAETAGHSARVYGETRYAAGTWARARRVIVKAEVLLHAERGVKDNTRFVVTNYSERAEPEFLYRHTYCKRGDVENRIKEIHEVALGRTSCTSFWANQFRVLLAAAAYMLMQEMRRRVQGTELEGAQVGRLRSALLKLGATVRRVVRRVYVSLPDSAAFAHVWCGIAKTLGGLRLMPP